MQSLVLLDILLVFRLGRVVTRVEYGEIHIDRDGLDAERFQRIEFHQRACIVIASQQAGAQVGVRRLQRRFGQAGPFPN